jgi:hypothetical protein
MIPTDSAALAAIHAWSAQRAPVIERVMPPDPAEGTPLLLLGRRLEGAVVARFGAIRTWALPLSDTAAVVLVPTGAHGAFVSVERAGLRSNAVPCSGLGQPRFVRADPEDGAAGVWRDPVLVLRSSHALDRVTLAPACVVLLGPAGAVACRSLLSPDRRALVCRPLHLLEPRTGYTLRVAGLCDVAGRPLPAFSSTFTTGERAFVEEGA